MKTIQPIETCYRGYRFRSRLEARWAVFFDSIGTRWDYEKEGFHLPAGDYLPDFWLPEIECFTEVKPVEFTKKEYTLCSQLPKSCILLDTSTPLVYQAYYFTGTEESNYENYISKGEYGRILLPYSFIKKRPWFLLGESVSDYDLNMTPEIKAKSSRFEYGENGAI